jgi:hypothetical protein
MNNFSTPNLCFDTLWAGRGLQTDSRLAALLTCSHLFVCKTKSGQDFGIEQRSLKSLRILYSV